MKYKIGQICYMTNGFSGFLKATGLKLPLKCKVESYNQIENNYDVLVIESKKLITMKCLMVISYVWSKDIV